MISEKILGKIRKRQAHISTNEDLSEFGYVKAGKGRSGTITWKSKEKYKEMYQKHKEKHDECMRRRYQGNTEEILRYMKKHYQDTIEERTEYQGNYYQEHIEERKEYGKNYYQDHIEELNEQHKTYNKTPKGKEVMKKTQAKRNRELGFEPLNEPFEGSHAHHITKDIVIYIPEELYRSVSHNVFTGKGMEEINGKVLVWLSKNEPTVKKRTVK